MPNPRWALTRRHCRRHCRRGWLALAACTVLTACGGGGGGAGTGAAPAQVCAPENPFLGDASASTRPGSLDTEKAWLAGYMDGAYLWYREIPAVDRRAPAFSRTDDVYGSLEAYFHAQLTPLRTASGADKDRFSFVYPTRLWNELIGAGAAAGYGIEWHIASPTPPRGIRIASVEPGSPAAAAGLRRGDLLLSADGVSADDTSDTGMRALQAALFPAAAGQSHSFAISREGVPQATRSLGSTRITKDPVPSRLVFDEAGRRYGYLLFNDHTASAEPKLIEAISYLRDQGVQDLVLDLRYNGGGYLFVASELAYMIAGPGPTTGKVFERLVFNDKRSAENEATPFYNQSCILDERSACTDKRPLPVLGLGRVSVITTGSTCSASEAIINGLQGIGLDVRVIGGTTCGKPYGFTAKDNCGISYFPIEFRGENHAGFGDYGDGLPAICPAADDLAHDLGAPEEGMLRAAVYNLAHDSCLSAAAGRAALARAAAAPVGRLLRGPERETRVRLPGR